MLPLNTGQKVQRGNNMVTVFGFLISISTMICVNKDECNIEPQT